MALSKSVQDFIDEKLTGLSDSERLQVLKMLKQEQKRRQKKNKKS